MNLLFPFCQQSGTGWVTDVAEKGIKELCVPDVCWLCTPIKLKAIGKCTEVPFSEIIWAQIFQTCLLTLIISKAGPLAMWVPLTSSKF